MAGAPLGNTNASKENRLFGDTLRRAIAQDDGKRLRKCIEAILDKGSEGDLQAALLLADRLDGKPAQAITGPDGGPVQIEEIRRVVVDPNAQP